MVLNNPHTIEGQTGDMNAWFDEMVSNLRYDEVLMDNDILDDNKREAYHVMASGNQEKISFWGRQASSAYFIASMVDRYFKELIKSNKKPNKLGLELSDSKVLVWAEVLQDDEEMEDILILAEAKVNAYYSKYGFYISSTIVEDCDGLEIPNHYKKVALV